MRVEDGAGAHCGSLETRNCGTVKHDCTPKKKMMEIGMVFETAVDPDVPLSKCLVGAACHSAYIPLLRTFQVLNDIFSLPSILDIIATLLNHFMWYRHFISVKGGPGSASSASGRTVFFLVFVWAMPVGFFISMVSADDCFPGGDGTAASRPKRRGIFKEVVVESIQRWSLSSKTLRQYQFRSNPSYMQSTR